MTAATISMLFFFFKCTSEQLLRLEIIDSLSCSWLYIEEHDVFLSFLLYQINAFSWRRWCHLTQHLSRVYSNRASWNVTKTTSCHRLPPGLDSSQSLGSYVEVHLRENWAIKTGWFTQAGFILSPNKSVRLATKKAPPPSTHSSRAAHLQLLERLAASFFFFSRDPYCCLII